jgi:hypothetical protein
MMLRRSGAKECVNHDGIGHQAIRGLEPGFAGSQYLIPPS